MLRTDRAPSERKKKKKGKAREGEGEGESSTSRRSLRLPKKTRYEESDTQDNVNKPKGLVNLGNTCYLNSILQCLSATKELQSLPNDKEKFRCHSILRKFLDEHEKVERYYSPKEMCELMKEIKKDFDIYKQGDAFEALKLLLSYIYNEGNIQYRNDYKEFKKSPLGNIFGQITVDINTCPKCTRELRNVIPDFCVSVSIPINMQNLNEEQLSMKKEIAKMYTNKKIEIKNDLIDMLIPNKKETLVDKKKISVQDCLNDYFSEQTLAENYCKLCGEASSAKLTSYLWKPSDVLIVHLKRFEVIKGRTLKNKAKVTNNKEITIDGFELFDRGSVKSDTEWEQLKGKKKTDAYQFIYQIYAIVVHSGSLDGGHYRAYVERKGQWYYTSDKSVRECKEDEALRSEATMLFYRRKPQ